MEELPVLPIYEAWRRPSDSEVVTLHMHVNPGHFVIDVGASRQVWSEIQAQLKDNPAARAVDTPTSSGVGQSTTSPTIRPHSNATRRVNVQRAAEDAMKALGFALDV